jgi:hypothetical protein
MVPIADVYLSCAVNLPDREVRPSCPPTSLPNLLISPPEQLGASARASRTHLFAHYAPFVRELGPPATGSQHWGENVTEKPIKEMDDAPSTWLAYNQVKRSAAPQYPGASH